VRVTLNDGRVLYNHSTTAVGYASSSEPLVRFGLGKDQTVKSIEVGKQVLSNVKADRIVEVR